MHAQGRRNRTLCVAGVRTAWHTIGDGEFFCPDCGGDRNYRRRAGRRRFVLLGVPLVPRGPVDPVVECSACHDRFGMEALDHPTTTRLSAMLRDAVHTIVLAVLAAGGTEGRAVRRAAVSTVRSAGFADCDEEQLLALIEALAADTGRRGAGDGVAAEAAGPVPADGGGPRSGEDDRTAGAALGIELHEALGPLGPHLAPTGRESLLLQGARIAAADGPYLRAEREVLETVGQALAICPEDTDRLLTVALAPS